MKKLKLFQADNGVNYLVPFILVTTLFFLWGFAHSILDVLNKHFQDAFTMNKTRSALVQAVVYGGYFIMALPAGRIIRRFGYRTGVSTGLLLYGIGALMFIPGSYINSFEFFLLSLFMLATGFALYGEGLQAGSWADRMFGWLIPLLGQSQGVHTWHHLGMWAMVIFVIAHIYAAVREDIMGRQSIVSTMVSGYRTFKD